MSDHAHRIMMRQLNADDNMIQADEDYSKQQILAEAAYQQEQAMQEGMPEPSETQRDVSDRCFSNWISLLKNTGSHRPRWSEDDGDLLEYRSEDVI
tara:strand:+ start:182 stop:469 length:288 start_codon:yes stop_codon:yes gene_type:complete